jgi:hypothetical protein
MNQIFLMNLTKHFAAKSIFLETQISKFILKHIALLLLLLRLLLLM